MLFRIMFKRTAPQQLSQYSQFSLECIRIIILIKKVSRLKYFLFKKSFLIFKSYIKITNRIKKIESKLIELKIYTKLFIYY